MLNSCFHHSFFFLFFSAKAVTNLNALNIQHKQLCRNLSRTYEIQAAAADDFHNQSICFSCFWVVILSTVCQIRHDSFKIWLKVYEQEFKIKTNSSIFHHSAKRQQIFAAEMFDIFVFKNNSLIDYNSCWLFKFSSEMLTSLIGSSGFFSFFITKFQVFSLSMNCIH